MRMLLIAGVVFAALAGTGNAEAATPAGQACLGHDFSGYARSDDLHPFGKTLTTFEVGGVRVISRGLGTEVQAHLAGAVPDSLLPNSCNN